MKAQENMLENSTNFSRSTNSKWKYISFVCIFLCLASFFILYVAFVKNTETQRLTKQAESKVATNTQDFGISESTVLIEEKPSFFDFDIDQIGSYTKTGKSVSYKCYEKISSSTDAVFMELKQELAKDDRSIFHVCIYNDTALVVSIQKVRQMYHESGEVQLHIYTKRDGNWYYSESLLTSTEQELIHFQLVDWTVKNDIVFATFYDDGYAARTYSTSVFHYNLSKEYENPQVLEMCTYSISPGTSERIFNKCVRFSSKDTSSFIDEDDLP